ncbi:carbohydrate ABC transporter permease [Treponema sp. HNW]|uniref:carbohydrate ABC transporter permease n=1 Tax=Treponema sp. HNW TaxID=3116654 RepID=UPI003D0FA1C9
MIYKKITVGKIAKYCVLFFFSIIFLLPIYWVIISSFKTDKSIFAALMPFGPKALWFDPELYLGAFRDILIKRNFGRAIFNSFFVTFNTVFLGVLITSLCAFSFSIFRFRGKNVLFIIVLITFMIPFSSIALPLYQIVSTLRMIDTYWALILPAAANGLSIFLFRQFFMDIPQSYLEAAYIDGASWLTIYGKIYMSMSLPIIVSAGIIIFMDQWEAFLWPLLSGRSPAMKVIQVAIADLSQDNEVYWNQIFAACAISIVVPVLIVLPLQKYYILGISSSGIKE